MRLVSRRGFLGVLLAAPVAVLRREGEADRYHRAADEALEAFSRMADKVIRASAALTTPDGAVVSREAVDLRTRRRRSVGVR